MHRPRRHFNTIQSRAPDQVADQVTDGGVGLESGGLTEGSSYLVDGGVVDSLASKNILATDELDVAAEREEPGLSVHQALRHGLRQPEGQSQTAHLYGGDSSDHHKCMLAYPSIFSRLTTGLDFTTSVCELPCASSTFLTVNTVCADCIYYMLCSPPT